MKPSPTKSADYARLRDRAERLLKGRKKRRANPVRMMADVRKQLHELQVNEIELEMQNCALIELQEARDEVEQGLLRYTDLYDFAPIGYVTVDRMGVMQEVNLTAASIFGVPRSQLIGQRIGTLLRATDQDDFHRFLHCVFEDNTRRSCELTVNNAAGKAVSVRVEANAEPSGRSCRVVIEDISARKLAEDALRDAKNELELRVRERTLQLENANVFLGIEIEDHKRTVASLRRSELALRELAAYQEAIKEKERKRIAREIHDELGGLLGGISANISVAIKRTERAGLPANPLLQEIAKLADFAFDAIRHVIADLRPSVLDEIGLWAALEWYVENVHKRTGLRYECDFDAKVSSTNLDPERSTAVFRIVQEALTNVVRHAQASRVAVRARIRDDAVVVEVEDDGTGISQPAPPGRACWGLIGMDERARYFGGELTTGPDRPTWEGAEQRHTPDDRRLYRRRAPARTDHERRSNTRRGRCGTRIVLRMPLESPNAE